MIEKYREVHDSINYLFKLKDNNGSCDDSQYT